MDSLDLFHALSRCVALCMIVYRTIKLDLLLHACQLFSFHFLPFSLVLWKNDQRYNMNLFVCSPRCCWEGLGGGSGGGGGLWCTLAAMLTHRHCLLLQVWPAGHVLLATGHLQQRETARERFKIDTWCSSVHYRYCQGWVTSFQCLPPAYYIAIYQWQEPLRRNVFTPRSTNFQACNETIQQNSEQMTAATSHGTYALMWLHNITEPCLLHSVTQLLSSGKSAMVDMWGQTWTYIIMISET